MSVELILLLVAVAALAGFVDAIAGGGGLITVPALIIAGLSPSQAVATNKLQATFGVGVATHHFYKAGLLDFSALKIPLVFAALGAVLGGVVVQFIDASFMKKVIPFVLVAVAIYFLINPKPKELGVRLSPLLFGVCFAFPIAFYDGFFGPGAGSFYMVTQVAFLALNMVKANAHTKALNFTSNFVSLIIFIFAGQVMWLVGLPMILGQLVGAKLGAKMAVRFGSKLIRPLIVIICLILAGKIFLGG